MPSVHRRERSPYWFAAYILPDGRRTLRSTKQRDKRKALQVAFEYQKASNTGRDGRLSEVQARSVLADIFAIANREALPSATVKEHIENWLAAKRLEVSAIQEHENAAKSLLEYLGAKASKPIDAITVKDVTGWRASLAATRAGSTVNKMMKLARGAFTSAYRLGLVRENVFAKVDYVKEDRATRRAFTLDELKKVLEVASDDWRGATLFGVYTGQRLQDVCRLSWAQVNLEREEITFTPRKTGKTRTIPIAGPLMAYLMKLEASDNPRAPIFPSLHELATTSLSHQFNDLLFLAGLKAKTSHRKKEEKKGKNSEEKRRAASGLSFHCLRHTATSLLKNAGASDVIAREIIGHDSEAVSRIYTHIETKSMKKALDAIPDITA